MPDTDPTDIAAREIERTISQHRGRIRAMLLDLNPLEAIALLGFLTTETIQRFKPDTRTKILSAFCDKLQTPPNA
jgi:hypothetical protein